MRAELRSRVLVGLSVAEEVLKLELMPIGMVQIDRAQRCTTMRVDSVCRKPFPEPSSLSLLIALQALMVVIGSRGFQFGLLPRSLLVDDGRRAKRWVRADLRGVTFSAAGAAGLGGANDD